MYKTLISASNLVNELYTPNLVIVDCRFSLDDSERGQRDYLQSHITGAVYAHMNKDLSGEIIPGKTSRHPLPSVEKFVQVLSNKGISSDVQVVIYDNSGGSMAARLWWMLQWVGHEAVAVLDGGWQQWQKEGYPVASGIERQEPGSFTPRIRNELLFTTNDVLDILNNPEFRLFDARSASRYRGENETIDPVAGHITGALSAPFTDNLDSNGQFLSQEDLRTRYQALLGDIPSERAIFYCGSGITSAHDLLALAYAGLGEGRLYAGSWSEWITDPNRLIAKTAESRTPA